MMTEDNLNCFLCFRVGNMLFSVETQTTEERTQQYQLEVESIYKDLTAKGKALMLSTELGVRFISTVNWKKAIYKMT